MISSLARGGGSNPPGFTHLFASVLQGSPASPAPTDLPQATFLLPSAPLTAFTTRLAGTRYAIARERGAYRTPGGTPRGRVVASTCAEARGDPAYVLRFLSGRDKRGQS